RGNGALSRIVILTLSVLVGVFFAYEIRLHRRGVADVSGIQRGSIQQLGAGPTYNTNPPVVQRPPEIDSQLLTSLQSILPSGATIIEGKEVSSVGEKHRAIVLWMLSP